MKKVKIVVLILIIIVLVGILANRNYTNNLKFSNTSQWADWIIEERDRNTALLAEWDGKFDIPAPPSNTSEETRKELKALIALKSERTPEKLQEINDEIYINTGSFDGKLLPEHFNKEKFPKTSKLWKEHEDITVIVMQEKARFDRVRPHILEPSLEPTIDVPGHPAYPSGHSTQSYLIAEMFSLLDPERKDEFFAEAHRIARNREIAGVHYASDSEAGKILANQYIKIRLEDPEFVKAIEEAKEEWELLK